ncbi:hypothetical protein ABW20_dc0107476 [Dactylellina cionopaga]|nr:hypothetical protein ABW20_dc0107476 [Dactylellina cionopaga]
MAETSRARAAKNAAVTANSIQAGIEAEKDIKDGGWKFRKGEVVWAHQRSETPALGGTWFAAVVTNVPDTASFADYANIYTSVDQNRGLYRVQKCGSDAVVLMGKLVYDLKGLFLGPEKIWVGDAVRIPRPGGFLPDISIWDPKQYDVLVIRRIAVSTTVEADTNDDGTPERLYIFYIIGDVLTMYPRDKDNTFENLDRPVPNYIKNIGPDHGKWLARATPDGKQKPAALSSVWVLSRFYDPRIMALMDRRWSTTDDVLHIDTCLDDRAKALGITNINGEPIREGGRQRGPQSAPGGGDDAEDAEQISEQRLFTSGGSMQRPIVSSQDKIMLMDTFEAMSPEQWEEYRARSGNLARPKNQEEYQQQLAKKRRVD